jgi:hypothetical protein
MHRLCGNEVEWSIVRAALIHYSTWGFTPNTKKKWSDWCPVIDPIQPEREVASLASPPTPSFSSYLRVVADLWGTNNEIHIIGGAWTTAVRTLGRWVSEYMCICVKCSCVTVIHDKVGARATAAGRHLWRWECTPIHLCANVCTVYTNINTQEHVAAKVHNGFGC